MSSARINFYPDLHNTIISWNRHGESWLEHIFDEADMEELLGVNTRLMVYNLLTFFYRLLESPLPRSSLFSTRREDLLPRRLTRTRSTLPETSDGRTLPRLPDPASPSTRDPSRLSELPRSPPTSSPEDSPLPTE